MRTCPFSHTSALVMHMRFQTQDPPVIRMRNMYANARAGPQSCNQDSPFVTNMQPDLYANCHSPDNSSFNFNNVNCVIALHSLTTFNLFYSRKTVTVLSELAAAPSLSSNCRKQCFMQEQGKKVFKSYCLPLRLFVFLSAQSDKMQQQS